MLKLRVATIQELFTRSPAHALDKILHGLFREFDENLTFVFQFDQFICATFLPQTGQGPIQGSCRRPPLKMLLPPEFCTCGAKNVRFFMLTFSKLKLKLHPTVEGSPESASAAVIKRLSKVRQTCAVVLHLIAGAPRGSLAN